MNGSRFAESAAATATAMFAHATTATTSATATANGSIEQATTTLTASFDAAIFVGIPLAAIGFVLDVFTLAALTRLRLSFPSMRVVLASLCLADALLATATLGLLSIEYLGNRHTWPDESSAAAQRNTSCAGEVLRWLWDLASGAHLLTLLALAVQQFVSVRWPLQSDGWLSARCSTLAIAAVWAASCVAPAARAILIAVATAGDSDVDDWPNKGTTRFCYQVVRYLHSADPQTGAYSLPYGQAVHEQAATQSELAVKGSVLLAIGASYGYVFAAVHRLHEHGAAAAAAASAAASAAGYGSNGGGHQWTRRRRSDRRRGERRVLVTALVVTLLYLACYLPLFCYNMVRIYSDYSHRWPSETGMVLMTVVCVTTVLDPVVYAFRLTELRAGIRRAARRRLGLGAGGRSGEGRLLPADGSAREAAAAAALLRLSCCRDSRRDDCCCRPRGGGGGSGTATPQRNTSSLMLSPHISIDSTKASSYTAAGTMANGKGYDRGPSPASSQLGTVEPEPDATDSLIQGTHC